jgi:hypothetical protein
MKKIIAALALAIPLGGSANLEALEIIRVNLFCFNTVKLFEKLKLEYKEAPLIMGDAEDDARSVMSLWVNPISKTWTIVSTKKDVSCIVGTGQNVELIRPGKSV